MPKALAHADSLLGKGAAGGLAGSLGAAPGEATAGLDAFAKILVGKVQDVQTLQSGADRLVHQMRSGQKVDQAEVLTAVQQADIALSTMLQVRDKLLEAYRELQQIQI